MKEARVLVIGLDGATWSLIGPWVREGHLRNMARIVKRGVCGKLQSVVPPLSCPAWPCLTSGKNPGKLGIYDFLNYDPETHKTYPFNPRKLRGKPIWDILSEEDVRVGIINVPTSFPHPVNGFLISGMFTPKEGDFTYPKELKFTVNEIIGQYKLNISMYSYHDEDEFIKDVYDFLEKRRKLTSYLMQIRDWQFFMIVFTSLDRIQHYMWKYQDPKHPLYNKRRAEKYGNVLREFWLKLDKVIGELVEKAGDKTNVFIVSDHGFGTNNLVFYVNEWLKREGYLIMKRRETSLGKKTSKGISRLIKKLGLYNILIPLLPKKILRSIPPPHPSLEDIADKIDWDNTRAYSAPHTTGCEQIYINVRNDGSKGKGTSKKEYEKVRSEIIKKLKKLKAPEIKERLKVEVFKSEEVYSGPYVQQAPDILYAINGYACLSNKNFGYNSIFSRNSVNPKITASHRMNGILLACGPDIKKGIKIENAKIFDIAPTILHMFCLPIPKDVDGKVLTIFEPESEFAKRKPNYVDPVYYEKIRMRLRAKIRELKRLGKI